MNTSKSIPARIGAFVLCIFVFFSYVTWSAPSETTPVSPWPMYRQNPQHTGRANVSAVNSNTVAWKFVTPVPIITLPCIGADGTIYFGSNERLHDRYFYAINPDGTLKWKFEVGGNISCSPAVDKNGTIYFTSSDNFLYALDGNGRKLWAVSVPTSTLYVNTSSPLVANDGMIYVGDDTGILRSISPNGTVNWTFSTGNFITTSPAADTNGNIYLSSGNVLYSLAPNGSLRWSHDAGKRLGNPVIGSNNTIYIYAWYKDITALTDQGSILWTHPISYSVSSTPAVGKDNTLYIGQDHNSLIAINPDGTQKWIYKSTSYINPYDDPIIDADGIIFYGRYMLNPDGALRQDTNVGGSRIIGSRGEIYIGAGDALYCLTKASLKLTSPSYSDSWVTGTIQKIKWTSTNINTVKIEYSTDGGRSWSIITSSAAASEGVYPWTVPLKVSSLCAIRITNIDNMEMTDTNFFAIIAPPPSLKLLTPVGGENWIGGTRHGINWSSTSVFSVNIEYSMDNGMTWNTITSDAEAAKGSYAWIVPNTSSSKCLVRISDRSNSSLYVQSKDTFTLSAVNEIAVSAPTESIAGEPFTVDVRAGNVTDLFGTSFILKWNNPDIVDSVSVEQGGFLGYDVVFSSWINKIAGNVSIGITRKAGKQNVSGSGVIATITFRTRPLQSESQVLKLSLDKITGNKSDGSSLQLTGGTATIKIISPTVPVWPGDTNNNGTVDQADILPLGIYWASSGTPRGSSSIAWTGQPAVKWSPVAATYADANGDGTVSQNDVLPIGLNWGRTHAVSKEAASKMLAGGAVLQPAATAAPPIAAGSEVYVDVDVRDATGLFGLGFVLAYDHKEYLEPLSVEAGPFLGADVIFFPQVDASGDRVSVGISRKSGQGDASGSGTVVRVKFRASQAIERGSGLTFSLTDVTASTSTGDFVAVTPRTGSFRDPAAVLDRVEPFAFSLGQNRPNPFNPETVITYALGKDGPVAIDIYNVSGQKIRSLVNGFMSRGNHEAVWDGRSDDGGKVSAGLYLYRIRAGGFTDTKKMMFVQ